MTTCKFYHSKLGIICMVLPLILMQTIMGNKGKAKFKKYIGMPSRLSRMSIIKETRAGEGVW